MNDLAAPFRQLVERRLWPVAVLLVAALAAVPLVLAKASSDDAVPAPTASTAPAQGETQAIVSVASPETREKARKVLGSAKNPFRPAIKAKKAKVAQATSGASTTVGNGGTPASSGGSSSGGTGSGGGPIVPLVPGTPATPVETFELYSLVVRFGETTGEPAVKNLKRLKGLPGGAPKLVYLGLLSDHKTAVFLVDAAVNIKGDGRCEPSPDDCQTLRMKAGDTVFADVTQADGSVKQYELDLVKVITKKTTSTAVATKARASVATGGRDALRANISRIGRYRYSSRSGVLKVIDAKAWTASAAKASAAAAAAAPAS
jgi:hypothetical protein